MERIDGMTMESAIREHVEPGSRLMTNVAKCQRRSRNNSLKSRSGIVPMELVVGDEGYRLRSVSRRSVFRGSASGIGATVSLPVVSSATSSSRQIWQR